MDTGQLISIAIQAFMLGIGLLTGVAAVSSRLTRMEGKIDNFTSNCTLKHVRVDERLGENKVDVNSVGQKLDNEMGKVKDRLSKVEKNVCQ